MRSWSRVAFPASFLLVAACSGQPTLTAQPTSQQATSSPAAPTPSPTPSPAPTEAPALSIEIAHDGPVLVGDDLGDPGHYGATLPAAYFEADGVQHLYVVGFGDVPGDQQVFHATSPDGIDWTVDTADPFAGLGLTLSPPGPIPGTVMPAEDGGWQMYLWGVPAPQVEGAQIYRATATDPGGPWTADLEPVVPVGEVGDVDDRGIDFPAVVPHDDGYLMLYGANGGDLPNVARILLATSEDGVQWEKHGRVLEPSVCGGLDSGFIAIPRLFTEDDGYLALVQIGPDVAAVRSTDGENWTCASDGLAFQATDIPGSDRVHTLSAAQVGDDINVIIEALQTAPDGTVGSELWLAEVTGQ